MTPEIQGFPIRKSTDQSSFTSSPWLIAGYNVLHRLLVPRHPPIALSSLSKNHYKDARVHCEVLKIRAGPAPPNTKQGAQEQPVRNQRALQKQPTPQDPTTCFKEKTIHQPAFHTQPKKNQAVLTNQQTTNPKSMFHKPVAHPARNTSPGTRHMNEPTQTGPARQKLLRKEVIQPHLPVRLPCYDLVLITGPTFDGSLQKG